MMTGACGPLRKSGKKSRVVPKLGSALLHHSTPYFTSQFLIVEIQTANAYKVYTH